MEAKEKILVVDDEAQICVNVEKILSRSNYDVTCALNAQEALAKMAEESFSLLISDLVMPGMDGLELIKMVKNQWPLTKIIMFTAYSSTDTAMKAIQLGALDYIPKPFTPDELRTPVKKALAGELVGAPQLRKPAKAVGAIDVDMPFDREEVAKYTGEEYTDSLTRTDIPVVEAQPIESLDFYCKLGDMVCEIFEKVNGTCKAGNKTGECPKRKAMAKKAAAREKAFDADRLIGIDMPFDYKEVIAVTGPEYVRHLDTDGFAFVPYEEVKANAARLMREMADGEQALVKPEENMVLVIDDEVSVNNNIRKILSKKGFHVDQAVSKEEALERIEASPYQIVLLDLKLPGVKGLELLQAIREKRPKAMVIIITGYASIETAVESARLGAVDYLSKPFTPNEIRKAADNAMQLAA